MIEEASAEFERTQRELTAQTKENTNLLNLIRKLGEEELELYHKHYYVEPYFQSRAEKSIYKR